MNRRQLLMSAGAAGIALAGATRRARADATRPSHAPALGDATSRCIVTTGACVAHCLSMLEKGNTAMAACARAVSELEALVRALAAITPMGTPRGKALAALVAESARDCKVECDKHAAMPPCKACSESCVALIAAIKNA